MLVPRQHKSVVSNPQIGSLTNLAQSNADQFRSSGLSLQGMPLSQARTLAQAEVLAAAADYTASLIGQPVDLPTTGPWFVTGHQPELFHAGVWAKNFTISGLADFAGGVALNLIVDNDTAERTRITVPIGSREVPTVESVPFDSSRPQQPWEESVIEDVQCFEGFGERIRSQIRSNWHYEPLIRHGWDAAIRQRQVSSRLCDCLTAARVAVEREHGIRNLEVPMSRICSTRSFLRFAASLLTDLPRFQAHYNAVIRNYRLEHHLRSTTHPVPELVERDGWYEAPFWIWRQGDLRRGRPFARLDGNRVELRFGEEIVARFSASTQDGFEQGGQSLSQLQNQGVRFRSRALTTTLFSRLFLADLFIHGIGGAKYDEMTDQLCRRFLDIEPPRFATVSATFHLPLAPPFPVSLQDVRRTEQTLRDLSFNPDRFLSKSADFSVQTLIEEKRQLISAFAARRPQQFEHKRVAEINRMLTPELEQTRRELKAKSQQIQKHVQANSILQNREYSWCLQSDDAVSFLQTEFHDSVG